MTERSVLVPEGSQVERKWLQEMHDRPWSPRRVKPSVRVFCLVAHTPHARRRHLTMSDDVTQSTEFSFMHRRLISVSVPPLCYRSST